MATVTNPALRAFLAQMRDELAFAQALIRRTESGFELRHVEDRERAAQALRELNLAELRALAQVNSQGAFRPLKSAPNLQTGWMLRVKDDAELASALDRLYPGALADWFAAQGPRPPITNYREFTARQTGMYRITTMLTDVQAARVIRAGCHKDFCLKRRLWTVNSLAGDAVEEKSLVPCLEPCAILLEFARKASRIEQQEKMKFDLSPAEVATLKAALQTALANPDSSVREADFNAPSNPRRVQLLLEKLAALPTQLAASAEEPGPE